MADHKLVPERKRRVATVYDAVAGRLGPNGFLTPEQRHSSSIIPCGPKEVMMGSINARDDTVEESYNADEGLETHQILPESDLLKAAHAYSSDFYDMATTTKGQTDYKSLDETALLAVGILLEEAAREVLGKTGDMVLVEPEGLENGLPESKTTKHQIQGRVKPAPTPENGSEIESLEKEDVPAKKRKVA